MRRAVFLDMQGALRDRYPGATELRHLRLSGGTGPALRLLARLDYRLVALDGEASTLGTSPGAHTPRPVEDRLADLLFRERLSLDGFYACPHGSAPPHSAPCGCRRPLPGLLLRAAREHGIDLGGSWMVGGKLHDVEAGNRAGCRTMLLDKGDETEWRLTGHRIPTRMAPDLYCAAVLIVNHADGA